MKRLMVVIAAVGCAGLLNAKTCTWIGGSGSWSVADNWDENGKPETGDSVVLSASADATIENDLGDISLGRLTFEGGSRLTLTSTGTITLTGVLEGSNLKVFQNNCTAAVTVEAPLVLADATRTSVFGISGSATSLYLKGNVSGGGETGGIWFSGNSTQNNKVYVSGDNTYVGQTRFSYCGLTAQSATAFGAAGNEIWYSAGGGSLTVAAAGTYNYGYKPHTEAGTALQFSLTGEAAWTGPILLESATKTYAIGVGSSVSTLTISGVISGAGSLKFNGNSSQGNLVHVSGDNTYTGATSFSVCTLYGDSHTAFGASGNMVTCVAGGGQLVLTVPGTYSYGYTPYTEAGTCMTFSGAGDFEWAGPLVLLSSTKVYNVASPSGTESAPRKLTISGQISGDGKIRVGGNSSKGQVIVFTGDNSHAGTQFSYSCVSFQHTNAVGRAGSELTHVSGGSGYMRLDAVGVWNCDIQFGTGSWQELGILPGSTINGKIYGSTDNVFGQLSVRSSGDVYVRDGLDMPGQRRFYPLQVNNSYVHLCAASVIGGGFYPDGGTDWNGWVVLDAAGNQYGALNLGKTVNIQCGVADALDATKTVSWAGQMSSGGGYLDLNGYPQHAVALESDDGETGRYLKSGRAPTTLYLDGATQDYSTHALIQSGVSLVWNPSGNCTQTVVNRTHTTDGSIIVSNGTFRVAGTATFKNLTSIAVADGATFDIATSASAALLGLKSLAVENGGRFVVSSAEPFGEATCVRLAETAELALPADSTCQVAELWVWRDGEYKQVTSGSYAPGTIPQVTGGTIRVATGDPEIEEITWDAGAGDDRSIAAWDNWDDGAEHDLSAGWVLPTFASAGTSADVDRAVTFKGIRFDGAAKGFELTGAGSLRILEQGVTVAESRTNAIAVPVTLAPFRGASAQAWTVAENAVLELRAPLTSTEPVDFGTAGKGTLKLTEPSDFLGNFSHTGGVLFVSAPSNACGAATGSYELFINEQAANYVGTRFENTIVNRPVRIWGKADYFGALNFYSGTNVFNGKVSFAYTTRPRSSNGSTTIFGGGLYSGNYLTPGCFGTYPCDWIIRNKPMDCRETLEMGGYLHLILETPGNSVGGSGTGVLSLQGVDCRLDVRVDQAFSLPPRMYFGKTADGCKVRLNGHDLSVQYLEVGADAETGLQGTTDIGSSDPATLTVTDQNRDTVLTGLDLTGALSLVKKGANCITVDRALSATGTLEVVSGPFAFTANGSWKRCTGVTVSGGTLAVAAARTFGVKAALDLSGTGVIDIPSGVALRFKTVIVDGTEHTGTIGAVGSGADFETEHVTGGGVIQTSSGSLLLIR